MRKIHTFSPAISDTLETRSVPSIAVPAAHAFVFTHGAITTPPVVHPPGTFSNGTPTIREAPNGERFTLGSINTTAHTIKAAAVTPVAVHHEPGTFNNGTPSIVVATNGERLTLSRMNMRFHR